MTKQHTGRKKGKGKAKESGNGNKDNKKGESARTEPNPEQMRLFEDVMLRTVREMTTDLSKIGSTAAESCILVSKDLPGKDIVRELHDANSPLCKTIAVGCKELGETGERYLSVFSLVQPALNQLREKQGAVHGSNSGTASSPVEAVHKLIGDPKDKDLLLSLADSIFKDLELDEEANQNMSMQDMMGLMARVGGVVQVKVASGDLDMDKLQEQAMSFCSQIQHNPEMQNIISSNPVLAGLQSTIPTEATSIESVTSPSGHAAPPPVPGMSDVLMGMLSQFQP